MLRKVHDKPGKTMRNDGKINAKTENIFDSMLRDTSTSRGIKENLWETILLTVDT